MKTRIESILLILVVVLVSGCSSSTKSPDPIPPTVDTVVTALPDSSSIPTPKGNTNLPLEKLSDADRGNYAAVARAYRLTIEVLKKRNANASQWILDLKAAIKRVEEERERLYQEQRERRISE